MTRNCSPLWPSALVALPWRSAASSLLAACREHASVVRRCLPPTSSTWAALETALQFLVVPSLQFLLRVRAATITLRTFNTLVLTLALVSCASKRRSDGKDIDDITDIDFKKENIVRYDQDDDYYNIFDQSVRIDDSLIEETIHRASDTDVKLDKITGGKDEISQLAGLCYSEGFEKAFTSIDNLYRRYQKHPGYWNQVGNCYLLKGQLRKANLFYKQALKYNKKYSPAYNNIGNIHIQRKEYEKALAAFKRAYDLKKNSLTPAYNLAQIYLNFGVVDKAQRLLLSIENQRSGDPSVLGALAATYLFQGKVEQGLSYFRQIPGGQLSHPSIGLNYAVALKIAGNNKQANQAFGNVNNNRPEWKKYYLKVKDFVER